MRQDQPPPFAAMLGITVTHYSPDRIAAELPVRPELGNRNGNLHGGAVMALADDLGGAATIVNLPDGATTATIESKTNFFAAINVGDIARAECTPLHRGRTTMVWQTRITRGDGRLAAIVTQTQLVIPESSANSMPTGPAVVWFRDDLRMADHAALSAAAKNDAPLICVFVLDEESKGFRPLGGASRWWLAQSLRALDRDLRKLGQRLVLRRGPAPEIILALVEQSGAQQLYFNRRYDRAGIAADDAVIAVLKARGISGGTFPGNLLVEPANLTAKDGGPLRVFTPFWKRVLSLGDPRQPLPAPKVLPPAPDGVESERLEDWELEPTKPDWAGGLRESWTPGETSARKRLAEFLDGVRSYADERDRPDKQSTTRLSPHLRFGEISPVEVFHAARFAADKGAPSRDIEKFLSELGWREFSYHLLHHFPDLAARNLQGRFESFPWQNDAAALTAWQRGRTGYPIVDAGLRELWHTGWMHNRVRLVAASFLIKHLLIDWRRGEQWFWDTLVDADPANNAASWQWVAGSGADAAPYFRIFNPVLQGERFDPLGAYVRRWVPELAGLPDQFVHKPWLAPSSTLAEARVSLGDAYPEPIVDHDTARKRALAAFETAKR